MKKVKKTFVASTSYDLKDVRAEVIHFLKEDYKQELVYFESPDFPVEEGLHSHDICIDAVKDCDAFLLIIGGRYGGSYHGTKYPNFVGKSITWAETCCAYSNNIPVYTFVRSSVWDERPAYKNNKTGHKPFHVDDVAVFDFIDFIVEQPKDNWIDQFSDIVDLKSKIVGRLGLQHIDVTKYLELFKEYTQDNIERLVPQKIVPFEYYVRRKIEDDVYSWIENNERGFSIVVGGAGVGKTSLLCNIASAYLKKENYTVLFIEADLVEGFRMRYFKDKQFREIITHIKEIGEKKTIFLIDTLDLVAFNRGIKQLAEFIRDVRHCEKAVTVSAIRTPEYERLKEEGVIIDDTFSLEVFDDEEVAMLFNNYKKYHKMEGYELTQPILEICRNPLHMKILFEVYKPNEIPPNINLLKLYERYWDKKVKSLRMGALPEYSGPQRSSVKLSKQKIAYAIGLEMFNKKVIRILKSDLEKVIDSEEFGNEAYLDLIDEGVVREYENYVEFFHQTFLEYVIARNFIFRIEKGHLEDIIKRINIDYPFYRGILEYTALLALNSNKLDVYNSIKDFLSNSSSHFQHIILVDIISNVEVMGQGDKEIIEKLLKKDKDLIDYMLGLMIAEAWKPRGTIFDVLENLAKYGDWETKRRISEALPNLSKIELDRTVKIMEILRDDWDEKWGTDIRRRVIEAVPSLIDRGYTDIEKFLRVREKDEIYTIIANTEVLSDLIIANAEVLSHMRQIDTHRADELIELLMNNLDDRHKILVRWLLEFLEQIRLGNENSIKAVKNIVYNETPSLTLGKGDDAYRVCVARNISKLLDNYPKDALEIMLHLTRAEEHRIVRRPMCRALPDLIKITRKEKKWKNVSEKIVWALATDKDEIIPITLSDNLINLLKVMPEITKSILLYYCGPEGENTLKHFSENGRNHILRRVKEVAPKLLEFYPDLQESIIRYIGK
jgi:predicted ATPase